GVLHGGSRGRPASGVPTHRPQEGGKVLASPRECVGSAPDPLAWPRLLPRRRADDGFRRVPRGGKRVPGPRHPGDRRDRSPCTLGGFLGLRGFPADVLVVAFATRRGAGGPRRLARFARRRTAGPAMGRSPVPRADSGHLRIRSANDPHDAPHRPGPLPGSRRPDRPRPVGLTPFLPGCVYPAQTMKILITDGLEPEAISTLRKTHEVDAQELDSRSLLNTFAGYHALIVRSRTIVSMMVLTHVPNLCDLVRAVFVVVISTVS